MKQILNTLFDHKRLNKEQAREVLINISNNKYNAAQISAFVTVYLMREISVDELSGFREALLELAVPCQLEGSEEAIDLCGTGGDGKNTFNISTLSSLIVAGAGYKVIKHGNYGVSSACGSSNVLEALGYTFTDDTDVLNRQLQDHNICFLHAPKFHPAMATVGPIRRDLAVKTFFNLLGPLVNPASPRYQSVGVFSLQIARLYNYLLESIDREYNITYALAGYDEVSLTSDVKIIHKGTERILKPSDFNMPKIKAEDIHGGDTITEAKEIFLSILQGNGTEAQRNVVYTNAGLAIHTRNPKLTLHESIEKARESLDSGAALDVLQRITAQ